VKTPEAEKVQSLPGPNPHSVLVLAEYDLKYLHAGRYKVQTLTRDFVRKTSLSQESEFEVQ
jgi:hypothetical protein